MFNKDKNIYCELILHEIKLNSIYENDLILIESTSNEYWNYIYSTRLKYITNKNNHLFCLYDLYYNIHVSNNFLTKLKFFKDIYENIFLTNDYKDKVTDIFCRLQRNYNSFKKLLNIYRYKKSKLLIVTDLCLNPIDISKPTIYMEIYQNNFRYLFLLRDLINIIENALSNSQNFFSNCLHPKNPYNNIAFSKSILLNIYLHIKASNYKIPIFLTQYFLCFFNLPKFELENNALIRRIAIKNYVNNTSVEILYREVKYMINENCNKTYFIDKDFPKNLLVNIMKPYLHLYEFFLNYIKCEEQRNAGVLLRKKLDRFFRFNSQFGRKIILPGSDYIRFNSRHISYYNDTIIESLPDIYKNKKTSEIINSTHITNITNNPDSDSSDVLFDEEYEDNEDNNSEEDDYIVII